MKEMKILIGCAWPYANGSLHIGHLAGLLPADIIARYHRLKGDDVYLVSGSDCYGTPVAIRAKIEGRTPAEISESYHREFCDCFEKLGFCFDRYGRTTDESHIAFVQDFHKKLYHSRYITERTAPQAYCETCGTWLADRFVHGICPDCGAEARGDQCDACGSVLEPESLIDPVCSLCGNTPVFRESTHLFIEISKLEKELREFIHAHPDWRKNAIACGTRYINEGLRDRAITRDLSWGIDVPKEGYEDKKSIYGQRMYLAICPRVMLSARSGAQILRNYGGRMPNIIMYTARTISPFISLSFPLFSLPRDPVIICRMRLFPANT